MAERNAAPGLLRLPRELRDQIFSYLLDEHTDPPSNSSFPGERISNENFRTGTHELSKSSSIRYPKEPLRCSYNSLLLTNHQLRAEVHDLVNQRLASSSMTAELDIMFKGYLSWPTWVHFPSFAPRTSRAWVSVGNNIWHKKPTPLNINVNLRIFSTEGFRSNDGWPRQPGSGFRDLLTLLFQYIEFGPDFGHPMSKFDSVSRSLTSGLQKEEGEEKENAEEENLYRINTLSVNVTFHDMYTPDTHLETVHMIFKALKELTVSGIISRALEGVRARAKFANGDEEVEWENQWRPTPGPRIFYVSKWGSLGLINIKAGKLKRW